MKSQAGTSSIQSLSVWLPEHDTAVPARIHWDQSGLITLVDTQLTSPKPEHCIDVGNLTLQPGIVDTHAHINEPGRTEWEGFVTATRAAAAGGITTLMDMPLNSIPATTSLAALTTKKQSALGACCVDYGLWGGVIPGNLDELEPMIRAGVRGFKCFLCPSGVDEFPMVTAIDLEPAMKVLAKFQSVLLVHAEIELPLATPTKTIAQTHYHTYLASRPPEWEVKAIEEIIALSEKTGCRVHIVHLSAAEAIPIIAAAKYRGVPITVETCPHYLVFESDSILEGATQFKCAPPIRSRANREALWNGIKEGTVDLIVSDHSPCVPHLKLQETGNFMGAWGGIAGLQLSFLSMVTEFKRRGIPFSRLLETQCEAPARLAGWTKKGSIRVGADADFIVWNPDQTTQVTPESLHHRHKLSPYLGQTLSGVIESTWLRGQQIYSRTAGHCPPIGKWLG